MVNSIIKSDSFINVPAANSGIRGPPVDMLPNETSLSQFREIPRESDRLLFTHTFEVVIFSVYYSVVAFSGLLDAGNKKDNATPKS